MRIDRLDLLAFGPFTGLALELAQGQQGLHVVYGENETGKSSALRAIGDLLFGIAARSTDDFVHDMKALRLGGTLRTRDGKALAFVRRKGNQNVLLDPSTEAPLGDDALAPFLGGIDREEFERVFGLDHERLRKNAGALLERGDGATSAIVGSGLGIPELRHVVNALREEAEELWSARARNKPVNKTKAQLKELGREVGRAILKLRKRPNADWPGPVLDFAALSPDGKTVFAHFAEVKKLAGVLADDFGVVDADGKPVKCEKATAENTRIALSLEKPVRLPARLVYGWQNAPKATLADENGNRAPAVQLGIQAKDIPPDKETPAPNGAASSAEPRPK